MMSKVYAIANQKGGVGKPLQTLIWQQIWLF